MEAKLEAAAAEVCVMTPAPPSLPTRERADSALPAQPRGQKDRGRHLRRPAGDVRLRCAAAPTLIPRRHPPARSSLTRRWMCLLCGCWVGGAAKGTAVSACAGNVASLAERAQSLHPELDAPVVALNFTSM